MSFPSSFLALLLPALCVGISTNSLAQPEDLPPNVLFILADDLGWRDVGFMGNERIATPHLDALAGRAVIFTQAYANAGNCAPTRACLLSGQYPPRHGVYTVGSPERGESWHRRLIPSANKTELAPAIVTLAEAFRASGYTTAHFGKWHLGAAEGPHGPPAQGFDLNIGGNEGGHPKSYFSPYDNPELPDGPPGEHLTDRLTDEALRFMEVHRDRPFFVYLSYYAVHTPLQAKEKLVQQYEGRWPAGDKPLPVYAAMVETMDANIGRLLDRLKALGLDEQTIVVFTSDNGPFFPASTAAPLRGSKGMLYEGGLRVPALICWPGKVAAGINSDIPMLSLDWYPTLLDMAGIAPPEGQTLDGISHWPLLNQSGEIPERALFWHFPAYLEAYRGMEGHWRTTPAGAIRFGPWKLLEFFEDGRRELYQLSDDPGESDNLINKKPKIAAVLYRRLLDWRRKTGAPVPTEPNPDFRED